MTISRESIIERHNLDVTWQGCNGAAPARFIRAATHPRLSSPQARAFTALPAIEAAEWLRSYVSWATKPKPK
jgi:hypothetical protein